MPPPRLIRRVLVTGAAGFIGSALVRSLLQRDGVEVVSYDALTYAGLRESLAEVIDHPRHQFVHGDVAAGDELAAAIEAARPDTLMHLAAESHVDRSIAAPDAFVRTNVEGTATVLRVWRAYVDRLPAESPEAANEALLMHVSTDEVYGPTPPGRLAREGDAYAPSSPYAATKAAADHLVRAYERTYGLRSVIVCPTNNYGPRQFPEKLIPLATMRAFRREPIPLYGDGLQLRDWLHVEDCAAGLLAVAKRGVAGVTYHLAAGDGPNEEWTNRRVVEAICDAVDQLDPEGAPRRELVTSVTDRPGHDPRYALDASRTRDKLGWRPQRELSQGLLETVRWYAEHPEWVAAAESP